MRPRTAAAALALLALGSAAQAACPPHALVLAAVRAATRTQLEQLGPAATRLRTPLARTPGHTLGYEVVGLFRVEGAAAQALQRTFGSADSYACEDEPVTPLELPERPLSLGVGFASRSGAVVVVVHLPEGRAEVQLEGSAHATLQLSARGLERWSEAMRALALRTRTSPPEFYEQMRPPVVIPAPSPADTLVRDGARAPR